MKRIVLLLFTLVVGAAVWAQTSTTIEAESTPRSAKEIRGGSPYVEIKNEPPPKPAAGHTVVKERVNAIALPTVEDIRRDSDLFLEGTRTNKFQQLTQAAMANGFQTREAEMNLDRLVSDIQSKTDV